MPITLPELQGTSSIVVYQLNQAYKLGFEAHAAPDFSPKASQLVEAISILEARNISKDLNLSLDDLVCCNS